MAIETRIASQSTSATATISSAQIADNVASFALMPRGLISEALIQRYIDEALKGANIRVEQQNGEWYITGNAELVIRIAKEETV